MGYGRMTWVMVLSLETGLPIKGLHFVPSEGVNQTTLEETFIQFKFTTLPTRLIFYFLYNLTHISIFFFSFLFFFFLSFFFISFLFYTPFCLSRGGLPEHRLHHHIPDRNSNSSQRYLHNCILFSPHCDKPRPCNPN